MNDKMSDQVNNLSNGKSIALAQLQLLKLQI